MALTRILVPTDFSDHAALATRIAGGLARRHGARISLIHVDHLPGEGSRFGAPMAIPADVWTSYRNERVAAVERMLRERARELGDGVAIDTAVDTGEVAASILVRARHDGADLIVMGSHGADATGRFMLGSVAAAVAARSSCPVLITRTAHADRAPREGMFRRPLVAVDYCVAAHAAMDCLGWLVEPGAPVDLLHVWTEPLRGTSVSPGLERPEIVAAIDRQREHETRRLADARDQAALAGFDVHTQVRTGRPAAELLAHLDRGPNDLIIVGARAGNERGVGALGTVADRVLRHAPVPILIVPPPARDAGDRT